MGFEPLTFKVLKHRSHLWLLDIKAGFGITISCDLPQDAVTGPACDAEFVSSSQNYG